MAKESDLTASILTHLNKQFRTKAIKIHGSVYQERGTPDIFCVSDEIPYLFEVKVEGSRTEEIQFKRLCEWSDTGAVTAVVRSIAEVNQVMNTKRREMVIEVRLEDS